MMSFNSEWCRSNSPRLTSTSEIHHSSLRDMNLASATDVSRLMTARLDSTFATHLLVLGTHLADIWVSDLKSCDGRWGYVSTLDTSLPWNLAISAYMIYHDYSNMDYPYGKVSLLEDRFNMVWFWITSPSFFIVPPYFIDDLPDIAITIVAI